MHDALLRRTSSGVGGAHAIHHRVDHLGQEGSLDPEVAAVTDGPPHDLAEDVAAPFVAREDSIGDEERRGACVMTDHSERDVVRRDPAVRPAGTLGGGSEERGEQIGVVVGEFPGSPR